MKQTARAWLPALALTAMLGGAPRQAAADTWIYRPITLPRGTVAADLGFAIGHSPSPDRTGPGMNIELAFGASSDVELGIRTGLRFGNAGRSTHADEYARIFETESYGSLGTSGSVANPEIRVRWALARGPVLQLAFEGRFFLPIEDRSRFGVMPALPLWLRLGSVRLDSGVYVPIIFTEPDTTTVVSVPLAIWIQASGRTWLGPELGVRFWNTSTGGHYTSYPFGFGLGYSIGHTADLRLRVLFPDISGSAAARDFGAGISFQFRT